MRKIFFQKFLVPGFLILFVAFTFCCNSPHGPEILNNEEEEEEVAYPFNGEADFTGDEVTVLTKCWEFTLINVISLETIGDDWPNGYFVPVQFKVKNLHEYGPLTENDFKMIDRDENIYNCNTRSFDESYFPDYFQGSKSLKPNEEFTGTVMFDIPDQYLDSGLVLKFESWFTGTVIIFNILIDLSQ